VGLLLAGGSGLLRIVYGSTELDVDYIPVDTAVKVTILATWQKANLGNKDLSIYHASKSDMIVIKQSQLLELGRKLYWDVPFVRKIWFPGNSMTKCWHYYFINVLLFHLIPAIVLDLLLRIAGHKPALFKIQRKIYIGNMAVSYFMFNGWNFVNTRSKQLLDRLPKNEMKDFNHRFIISDEKSLYEYYLSSCDYARKNLLKEGDITPAVRFRTRLMYCLDKAVKYSFVSWATWMIFFKLNIIGGVYGSLCNYWNSL